MAGALLGLVALHLGRVQLAPGDTREDDEARLAYVASRIEAGSLPGVAPGHPFDGEWRLGTLSMAAVAATNLAVAYPQTRAARAEQVSAWARRLLSDEVRAYDTKAWGADALETLDTSQAHAGYLGHVVLALDAACLLGGERDEALHARLVEALARRMREAPEGLVETYPGEIYVPDNVVVMAALRQFDACTGTAHHAELIAAWLAQVRARWVDADNGLLVFGPGQRARGSGAAWNAFYLPFVDEAFAADQSARLWATFGDTAALGWLGGIREHPRGVEGQGDVDSGPLVAGVSPSATGFALADATRRGDEAWRAAVLRTAELSGITWGGRYLLAPLVGDAIVLAARSTRPWPTGPLTGAVAARAESGVR